MMVSGTALRTNAVICLVSGVSVHYELPMDLVLAGNRIANPSGLDSRVSGYTTFVSGARDRGLMVDGRDSFIRVSGPGHRHECFGDLSKCPNGNSNVYVIADVVATVLYESHFDLMRGQLYTGTLDKKYQ